MFNEVAMERHTDSEDHEIIECDKVEYNLLLARANKYASLSTELQGKYAKEFSKLVEKMDKLILEMGVDNASTSEWKNGFKLKGVN